MTNQLILRDHLQEKWWQFQQASKILTTQNLEEVLPILRQLDTYIQEQKYYIAGFISYEAAAAFDAALETKAASGFPLLWFGLFEKAEDFSFQKDKIPATKWSWQPNISKKSYENSISNIHQYIRRGDTYQVNFTFRMQTLLKQHLGDFELFQNIAPTAPYGAFMELPDFSIVSASPELFFHYKNGKIVSKPMKGTAPRGRSYAEDIANKNQLYQSQKDRSENVMIVDMIRNDLSKIATIGSVQTPHRYAVEKYPTVWQMTSTVEAETEASLSEIMTALFPCASITGAPKARTMRIISELEKTPRNIYTGTIGMVKPNGEMQFSVAIRTALFDKKKRNIEYGTGGGITIKSSAKKEYQECLLKAKVITQKTDKELISADFKLLETMLWHPKNGWFLLEKHLQRIQNSADYFDYKIDVSKIKKALFRRINTCKAKPQKVRLLVQKTGDFVIENYDLQVSLLALKNEAVAIQSPEVPLAKEAVNSNNLFLYHKTTNRQIYAQGLAQHPGAKDVILYNEKGEITESCWGNIVVFDGSTYWTPPVECGLLNGTFRQYLLEENTIRARIILKEEIAGFEKIFVVNSVRKWQEIKVKKEVEWMTV